MWKLLLDLCLLSWVVVWSFKASKCDDLRGSCPIFWPTEADFDSAANWSEALVFFPFCCWWTESVCIKKTAIWRKRALNPIWNKWFTSFLYFFLSNRKCNTKTVLIMTNNKQSVHCIWAPGWKASSFLDPKVYSVCSGHILSLWDREQTQETVSNSGTQTANMIHADRKNKNIQTHFLGGTKNFAHHLKVPQWK